MNGSKLPNIRVLQQHLSGGALAVPAGQVPGGGAPAAAAGFAESGMAAAAPAAAGPAAATLTPFMTDAGLRTGEERSVGLICQG